MPWLLYVGPCPPDIHTLLPASPNTPPGLRHPHKAQQAACSKSCSDTYKRKMLESGPEDVLLKLVKNVDPVETIENGINLSTN